MSGNNKWQEIWTGKEVRESLNGKTEFETFCILKEADGFDTAVKEKEKYYRGFCKERV